MCQTIVCCAVVAFLLFFSSVCVAPYHSLKARALKPVGSEGALQYDYKMLYEACLARRQSTQTRHSGLRVNTSTSHMHSSHIRHTFGMISQMFHSSSRKYIRPKTSTTYENHRIVSDSERERERYLSCVLGWHTTIRHTQRNHSTG